MGPDGMTYYHYWWGFDTLPVCNGDAKEWQEYITGKGGVIDLWFNQGVDGLRLDVADELTDYYIELIRKAVHRNKKDGFILGEVWENPMYMGRGYSASLLPSHGRGLWPRDVLKKVSRGLSRVEAGNPGFPRLVQVTSGGFSWWL